MGARQKESRGERRWIILACRPDGDIRTARVIDGVYNDEGHKLAKEVAAYWSRRPELKGFSVYVVDLGEAVAGPGRRSGWSPAKTGGG